METINNSKTQYKILAFILTFMVAIAPLGNIRKVKAIAGVDDLAILGGAAIIALIISGLAASGAISGDYTVSAHDLSAIQEKAQANLQAAGATAIDQANKLGEALKSGATSSAIKKLAQGSVIWAFLGAIQDVLWSDIKTDYDKFSSDNSLNGYHFVGSALLGSNYVYLYQDSSISLDLTKFTFALGGSSTGRLNYNQSASTANTYNSSRVLFKTATMSEGIFPQVYEVELYCNVNKTDESIVKGYTAGAATVSAYYTGLCLGLVNNNVVKDLSVSNIKESNALTIPTILPQNVINNINTWDGTSDLVLAPPLPYDIPTGEDLVIDPSYAGEGTVDPPSPTTDPDNPPSEEEGITLPWLATLLGLLGLGQLTGIDEGIKSGIDNLVDSITNTAQDVYDGVRDWADTASSTIAQGIEGVRAKLGEIAGVITGGLALGIESIQSALGSIAETIGHAFDPPSKNVDWDKLKNIQLFNKFPFSIPSDLYYLFGLVAADPVAPCVKIPFDMTFLGGENIDATVDLATYDNVAAIIRNFEFIAFVIGMLYLTKSLIWK